MKHRHLNTTAWSLAAIDSCITRGFQADYEELGQAAIKDPEIMQDIRRLCEAVLARKNDENYDRDSRGNSIGLFLWSLPCCSDSMEPPADGTVSMKRDRPVFFCEPDGEPSDPGGSQGA